MWPPSKHLRRPPPPFDHLWYVCRVSTFLWRYQNVVSDNFYRFIWLFSVFFIIAYLINYRKIPVEIRFDYPWSSTSSFIFFSFLFYPILLPFFLCPVYNFHLSSCNVSFPLGSPIIFLVSLSSVASNLFPLILLYSVYSFPQPLSLVRIVSLYKPEFLFSTDTYLRFYISPLWSSYSVLLSWLL